MARGAHEENRARAARPKQKSRQSARRTSPVDEGLLEDTLEKLADGGEPREAMSPQSLDDGIPEWRQVALLPHSVTKVSTGQTVLGKAISWIITRTDARRPGPGSLGRGGAPKEGKQYRRRAVAREARDQPEFSSFIVFEKYGVRAHQRIPPDVGSKDRPEQLVVVDELATFGERITNPRRNARLDDPGPRARP